VVYFLRVVYLPFYPSIFFADESGQDFLSFMERWPAIYVTCDAIDHQPGKADLMQWLSPKVPWCNVQYCERAANAGKLVALARLQWLRGQDPPYEWDESTCNNAARRGNLQVLQWARAQDPPCPWCKDVCIALARNRGHRCWNSCFRLTIRGRAFILFCLTLV
jgi:hypothetical protein